LEKWRATSGTKVSGWLGNLEQLEALVSLAGFAYANPDFVWPHVEQNNTPIFRARNMGHPLIPAAQRVNNDFSLEGLHKTTVITGSNMSGKSTFLRTVGVNAVLAYAGAPVCADYFEITCCHLFTSMRTKDSLSDSTSSFFAELKRLKQLLGHLEGSAQSLPTFYMLDEILKGTNSTDRREGTKAVIRQLHGMNASGLIATHDLEIAEMQEEFPGDVANVSFHSELQNGQLVFDYKMRQGVCQSFNASDLMALMGIG
jgi:DNA mismatch repair ATPase MutS